MTTPIWQPVGNGVASITNANPGVVTTTTNHGYFTGLIVQFFFPRSFGMVELLGNTYAIIVLSPTTFSINQDTTNFNTFVIASTKQEAQVIPVGEVASTLANSERNLLTPVGGGI